MSAAQWILLLTLSLLWGGSFLFVELALLGLPVLTIVWLRVAGAALALGLWLGLGRGAGLPKGWAVWRALLVMGLLNNAVPFTLFVFAQAQITGGLASILNATTPLWTVIVAHIATRDERLTRAKAFGLALGFSGVWVIGGGGGGSFGAIAACLGAALSYGLAAVWGRRFKAMGLAAGQVAFGMLASSSMIVLPIWLLQDRPWSMLLPPAEALAAVAALSFFCTALAYILYFRLLAGAGATMLSLVTFIIPAFAIALGAVFLGERMQLQDLAGLALILTGLLAMDGRLGLRAGP